MRGVIADWVSIGVASALMMGGGIVAGACFVPAFYASVDARAILASSIGTGFCAASADEVWRGRAERLVSRYPAMILLGAYGLCSAVRIPAALIAPLPKGPDALQSPWVAILCFAAMPFTIAIAFTLMASTKARAERSHRLAASIDPLTGIADRRAFAALRLPTLPNLRVGVSIGVAVSRPGREGFDALMRRADLALCRAKQNGRSRTELADADLLDADLPDPRPVRSPARPQAAE